MGAGYHRGSSNQEVETPPDFMSAVQNVFGSIGFDLAASEKNAKAPLFFTEAMNSLEQKWHMSLLNWLNPPYANIGPWAKKCLEESQRGCKILMLVPASVGSNWWRDYVHEKASVWFLNGRLTFVGEKHPYPKDLALILWGRTWSPGYHIWTWKNEL
ncbi:MAG: hypothetical protein KGL39_18180 [Patescibacteria group bacterium]|nr:hypothetical protein [Patescibacteria group bacterium]